MFLLFLRGLYYVFWNNRRPDGVVGKRGDGFATLFVMGIFFSKCNSRNV